MVDISVLKSKGVTSDRLKAIFAEKASAADARIADRIKLRISDRVWAGVQYNLNNYRVYHACDLAWDTPFRQTTHSLVKGLLDRKTPTKEILSALEGVDISDMLQIYDKSGKLVTGKIAPNDIGEVKVNAPTFFHIYIPLAKAYTTIRAAAITNSYRQVPLFDYQASKSTADNRTKSQIITDRVELMSSQYGYAAILEQAVLQMLHYSHSILFPSEEWHDEPQWLNVTTNGKTEQKKIVVKEGVRFNLPHPSRTFIDTAFRPSTINTDTGTMFGGYWRVARVGEVMDNTKYWNNTKITDNNRDLRAENPAFFNTVYSSCAISFGPTGNTDKGDRETKTAFYTSNAPDRAVVLTEYFEKVNPKDEGIGDYDGMVWFRYCVAGQDTVIYATPLPYSPMVYFGYDALETRAQNASMTLEILPFQDHISNLFSQYLLTVKQNLANVTFFDTNQVNKDVIDDIRNLGQKNYTANNYFPMDMRTNRIGQNNVAEAFQTHVFPHQPTNDLLEGVGELLKVLERVLVISPQELAQTASHELTAEEVKNINAGKSTRYEFTAGHVDRAVYAWKNLLYAGLMAYAEEDLYARLPLPVDEASLTKLGFTVEHRDEQNKSALVTGNKSAILIESFSANRDGDLRVNNAQTAQAMTQVLASIAGNPMLSAEVGPKQIIELINEIAQIGGLPRDFRFTPTGEAAKMQAQQQQQAQQAAQQAQQAVQQQAQQIEQAAVKEAVADVAKQLAPVFQQQAQKFQTLEQQQQAQMQQLQQVVQALQGLMAAAQQPTPQPYDAQGSPYPADPGGNPQPPQVAAGPSGPPV